MLKFMKLGGIFDIEAINKKIEELEKKTFEPDFWNTENSQEILKNISVNKKMIEEYEELNSALDDLNTMVEFIEMGDDSFESEIGEKLHEVEDKIQDFKIKLLLDEKYDSNNAILTINSGAGGTEACDWAEMLYRLYDRWANKHDFKVEILDSLAGEEAGIKSVTFLVSGEYAYGYLKSEHGVHRLVRISPFDAGGRRHTSFASVEILPEIKSISDVEIKPDDIKMDVYRASGAGGQHVNKTSSAVRLTHIPTGIVVACQTQRSQFQNKDYAMKMLISKLIHLKEQEHRDTINDLKGVQMDIAWGSQIRSYVFCPYTLVKDHRTNYEIGDVQKVMDGYIDPFIFEYLKYNKKST